MAANHESDAWVLKASTEASQDNGGEAEVQEFIPPSWWNLTGQRFLFSVSINVLFPTQRQLTLHVFIPILM